MSLNLRRKTEEVTLSDSLEDYIETILVLARESGSTRVSDVAAALNVKLPSVNKAVSELKKMGLVEQEPYGLLELTPLGRQTAGQVLARHELLKKFLLMLGVGDSAAEEDACRMEHMLSIESIECISAFVKTGQLPCSET